MWHLPEDLTCNTYQKIWRVTLTRRSDMWRLPEDLTCDTYQKSQKAHRGVVAVTGKLTAKGAISLQQVTCSLALPLYWPRVNRPLGWWVGEKSVRSFPDPSLESRLRTQRYMMLYDVHKLRDGPCPNWSLTSLQPHLTRAHSHVVCLTIHRNTALSEPDNADHKLRDDRVPLHGRNVKFVTFRSQL